MAKKKTTTTKKPTKKTTTTKKPRTPKKKVEAPPIVYRYEVVNENGSVEKTNDPAAFCRAKRLNHQLLYATLKGARSSHRGWTLREIGNDN